MNQAELLSGITQDLIELGLNHMATDMRDLAESPEYLSLSPLEFVRKTINHEYEEKKSRLLQTRIRNAHLTGCSAILANCKDSNTRTYLPVGITDALSSLSFIEKGWNVCILGASGSGKTYLAQALVLAACNRWTCDYNHMDTLFDNLVDINENNPQKFNKKIRQLANVQLLVLDDFLLHPMTGSWAVKTLFAILESRREHHKSTIVCSQRKPQGWRPMLENDPVIADSIITRVAQDYTICIETPDPNA